jgi:TPR repeat protein
MGIGTAKNKDEAIKWFQKAADQGHEDAKKRLDKLTKKKWFF